MRFFSFTVIFRVVVSATLPLGSFNRLSLHVMGLSPNSKAHNTHTFPSTPPTVKLNPMKAGGEKEVCETSPSSMSSAVGYGEGHFPSLATVFDCRGGHVHSMHSTEDNAVKASDVPVHLFGMELSLFGLKLLLQLGLTLLNVACW